MLLRRIARPMLGSMFVVGGIDTLRHPQQRAERAAPVITKLTETLPVQLPKDPVDVVRMDAAVKIAAGLALSTGRMPRLAALVLAGSLVPTTIGGHPFWKERDPAARAMQQTHFFKNLAMLGGLLLAAADTEGRPSIGYRTRHAAATTTKETKRAAKRARKNAAIARRQAASRLPG
jgi:putative oxidoreductase